MKKLLLIACLLPLFSFAATTAPLAPSNVAFASAPIPLYLDPEVNTYRVPAPSNFKFANAVGNANIQINFLAAGSSEALWGDNPIAWPSAAQAAFQYAANVWESQLQSSVPITVNVAWVNNLGPGVLGHGGPLNAYRDFSNAPQAETYYPVALANSIAGSDLDPANVDIYIAFSSEFNWYTGTDGNPAIDQTDLASVSIHELCHGLGFIGRMTVEGDNGSCPYIYIYDRFTEDATAHSLLSWLTNPSYLGSMLRSGSLYFDGANANADNSGRRVPIYAPSAWNSGSSYSHLDESFNNTPNALMTYSLSRGESIHSPGDVVAGIFKDMGWNPSVEPPTTHTVSLASQNPNSGVSISYSSSSTSGSCSTPDSVEFDDNSSVTFIAPDSAGGNSFDYWQKDGSVTFANREISLSITADTSLTAVYASAGSTECKITLKSQNPNNGVTMSVSPADNYGNSADRTTCEFYYDAGSSFSLSTPETIDGNSFSHWNFDGALIYSRNLTVTINSDVTMTAVYVNGIPGLIELDKISGSISWNDKSNPGIGSISLKGSILSPVSDLSSLDSQWFNKLFTLNASSYILELESGAFQKLNKKATSAKFYSSSGKSKIMAKFKLKNDVLYFTYKGVRGNNLPSGMNISNFDSSGWVDSTVHVTLNAGTITGTADVPFRYSTKANKKSKIK